ncbi:MAG: DUF3426 domain-containing protein [Burkholderiaceae bacterium]|nr:DUF3426 domain-containing protein [Burkholderiaceae bacterium]
MNLATRCTACGTIFRVVQDQLKVSDGWVRCGRCQAVFNAQKNLFDLEREAPPPWQPDAQSPEADRTADASVASASDATPTEETDLGHTKETAAEPESEPDTREAPPDQDAPLEAPPSPDLDHIKIEPEIPSEPAPSNERNGYADPPHSIDEIDGEPMSPAETEPAVVVSTAAMTGAPADEDAATEPAPAVVDADADAESATSMPDFVRRAEREQWWEQAPVRAALTTLAVLAALGLALQITGHYRQRIAAQWPESTAWLQRYCAAFNCRLEPLRRIDDVSIESTALTQADASLQVEGIPNALRLAVTLRNRGELPIAMPSVDLSLTGADGELVSRRSLAPADFQVNDPRLAPGVDLPLSVSFSVTGRRVSGYTVEVFYP